MTSPADTIREWLPALRGSAPNEAEAICIAALTELEQQLADLTGASQDHFVIAAKLDELRAVAEAADTDGREWEWQGGYPQKVVRTGDVVVVADCFESPDAPSVFAEYIASFDPPTVLALLDLADRLATPDTPPAHPPAADPRYYDHKRGTR